MTQGAEAGVLSARQCVAFGKQCRLSSLACIDRVTGLPDEEPVGRQIARLGDRDAFRNSSSFPEDITAPYRSPQGAASGRSASYATLQIYKPTEPRLAR